MALERIGEEAPEASTKDRYTDIAIGLTFGCSILIVMAAWLYILGCLLVRAIVWAMS